MTGVASRWRCSTWSSSGTRGLVIWLGRRTSPPGTAASSNSLADCLERQGKYAEALRLYQNALEINRKALGAGHPDTARSYFGLAACLDAQGKQAQALPIVLK